MERLTPWTDRLAFDVALMLEGSGEHLPEVLDRHKLEHTDLLAFNNDPVFLRRVTEYREDIQEKGLTFRLKARAQAEELLATSWHLIHAPDVSPAVKADLIKSTVKWGGLEPKGDVQADVGGGVKITINLGPNSEPKTINGGVRVDADGGNGDEDDYKPRRHLPEMPA